MSSPPFSSGGLFFPSPGHNDDATPADEVSMLIAEAEKVKSFKPALATFMASNGPEFLEVFGRQIELIKSRSQAFEDGHVTVYDKVLLAITRNGNELNHPAAVEFYCEEYLGINKLGDPADTHEILHQRIGLQSLLNQAQIGQATDPTATERETDDNDADGSQTSQGPEMEDKLKRLWKVYRAARKEFIEGSANGKGPTLEAAKFLRDTAENTVQYLKNKNTDPLMLSELQATCETAKSAVEALVNGRVRKFDSAAMERVRGTPRAPSHFGKNGNGNRRQRGLRQEFKPEESGRHPGPVRGAGTGRGHSGVPFGYSRPVDSYHPGSHRSNAYRPY